MGHSEQGSYRWSIYLEVCMAFSVHKWEVGACLTSTKGQRLKFPEKEWLASAASLSFVSVLIRPVDEPVLLTMDSNNKTECSTSTDFPADLMNQITSPCSQTNPGIKGVGGYEVYDWLKGCWGACILVSGDSWVRPKVCVAPQLKSVRKRKLKQSENISWIYGFLHNLHWVNNLFS